MNLNSLILSQDVIQVPKNQMNQMTDYRLREIISSSRDALLIETTCTTSSSSSSGVSFKDTFAGQSLTSRDPTQAAELKVGLFNHWTALIQTKQNHPVSL